MNATAPFADVQRRIAALAAVATPAERDELLVSAVLSGKLHVVEHVAASPASRGPGASRRVSPRSATIFGDALDCLVRPAEARADGPCLWRSPRGSGGATRWRGSTGWAGAILGSPQVVHACIDGGPAVVDYATDSACSGPTPPSPPRCARPTEAAGTRAGGAGAPELLWLGYDVSMVPAWNAAAARAHRRGRATVASEQRLAVARPGASPARPVGAVAGALPARAPLTAYGRLPARGAIGRARSGVGARASGPPTRRRARARRKTHARVHLCIVHQTRTASRTKWKHLCAAARRPAAARRVRGAAQSCHELHGAAIHGLAGRRPRACVCYRRRHLHARPWRNNAESREAAAQCLRAAMAKQDL